LAQVAEFVFSTMGDEENVTVPTIPPDYHVPEGFRLVLDPMFTTPPGILERTSSVTAGFMWTIFWVTGWIARIAVILALLGVIAYGIYRCISSCRRRWKYKRFTAHPSRSAKQCQYFALCGCVTSAVGVDHPFLDDDLLLPANTLVLTLVQAEGLPGSKNGNLILDAATDDVFDNPDDPTLFKPSRPHPTTVAKTPKGPVRNCKLQGDKISLDWHGDENFVIIRVKEFAPTKPTTTAEVIAEVRIPATKIASYAKQAADKKDDPKAGTRKLHLVQPSVMHELLALQHPADVDDIVPSSSDPVGDYVNEMVQGNMRRAFVPHVEDELNKLRDENQRLLADNDDLSREQMQENFATQKEKKMQTQLAEDQDAGYITVKFELSSRKEASNDAANVLYRDQSFHEEDFVKGASFLPTAAPRPAS